MFFSISRLKQIAKTIKTDISFRERELEPPGKHGTSDIEHGARTRDAATGDILLSDSFRLPDIQHFDRRLQGCGPFQNGCSVLGELFV